MDKDENTVADIGELVTTLAEVDSYFIFVVLVAVVVGLEHLAFRTPAWQRREFVRRAIGIQTVLVLFLLVVWLGDADALTWLMVQGGFLVAAGVKAAMAYMDELRASAVMGRMANDDDAAQDG